ncbi:MAG: SDR family NAD(P)-dependent oxidoreductase [Bacteroidales bacterium]|nr:SDR family NAD(P)-dependent oxidoreductase [Bacteroidales bacterium]
MKDKALESKSAYFIEGDFCRDQDIDQIIETVGGLTDKIDIMVHSAGVIYPSDFENSTIEKLDEHYQVNVRAPYQITRKLLDPLKKARGQVIFINSTAGLDSWEGISQYAASKYALRAIAISLIEELGKLGIRVSSIYPGGTATPMQEFIQSHENHPYDPKDYLSPDHLAETVMHLINLPKSAHIIELTIKPFKN